MSWDGAWEKVFNDQEWGKYPAENLIRFVARNFYKKDRKTVKILEVGCGPGANIWYLAREGFDVSGLDGSKTAIEQAKSRLSKEGLKADLRQGDIVHLPYNDMVFDAVIDCECISCNSGENSGKILAEIKRVLKVSGLFYSRTFTDEMYIGKTRKELGNLEYTDISDGPFRGKGLQRLVDRKGIEPLYGKYFSILSVDKMDETQNNQAMKISEWIIACKKEG